MEIGDVAVNPNTNKIYVANYINNTVSVIDGTTYTVKNVNVGNRPNVIAVNPNTNKIYVANSFDSTVSVIDGSNNTQLGYVNDINRTTGLTSYPMNVAVNPNTNMICVTNLKSGTISFVHATNQNAKNYYSANIGSRPSRNSALTYSHSTPLNSALIYSNSVYNIGGSPLPYHSIQTQT